MKLYKDNLGKVSITVEKDYWDINENYDKLTVVEKEGAFGTYISRKPVPAGTPLTNREYWIPFSSIRESLLLDYEKFKNEVLENVVFTGEVDETIDSPVKQQIGENIFVDTEDIEVEGDTMKLADRDTSKGMGYKILRLKEKERFYPQITLECISKAYYSGMIHIEFDNRTFHVELVQDDSNDIVANKIYTILNNQLGDNFKVSFENNIVTIVKNDNEKVTNCEIFDEDTNVDIHIKYETYKVDKNILNQEDIEVPNTIYEIRYDFDLNNKTITIPKNCVLKFEGGSFSNGSISGNRTYIDTNPTSNIFNNILLKGSITNKYVYPNWFGAKGDGINDDTKSFRDIGTMANLLGVNIKLANSNKYLISDYINNGDTRFHIEGDYTTMNTSVLSRYGYIKLAPGTSLFKDSNIYGSIINCCIIGKRLSNVRIFENCNCNGFNFYNNIILDVEAIFYNSSISSITRISFNTFLSTEYFSKAVNGECFMTDSVISNNYINGGAESVDNACFQFCSYNGSDIHDNFIDYYRTIYELINPVRTVMGGNINSNNNQYQVFRYFYKRGKGVSTTKFNSSHDKFNWTNINKLDKLKTYIPYKQIVNDEEIDIPEYIVSTISTLGTFIMLNPVFEEHCSSNIVHITDGLTQYENTFIIKYVNQFNNALKCSYTKNPDHLNNPIYSGGTFKDISIVEFDDAFIETVEQLPYISNVWTSRIKGQKVKMNNVVYVATFYKGNIYWIPVNNYNFPNVTSSKRPSDLAKGTTLFDTTLNKPIWWTGTKWIDATGADV